MGGTATSSTFRRAGGGEGTRYSSRRARGNQLKRCDAQSRQEFATEWGQGEKGFGIKKNPKDSGLDCKNKGEARFEAKWCL